MNLRFKNCFAVAAMAAGMCFISCTREDVNGGGKNSIELTNADLKAVLQQKGYDFDENGNLVKNEKVENTKTLDLSGTKLVDFAGLDVFPNLTELKLSDNGYGPAFDFAKLPKQITGVDLTGNEIYDYNNLIKVEIAENGDENITNVHTITKLYLPEEAKDNCTDLMRFYRQNKEAITSGSIDMKMEDEEGKLQSYTTLREVPDENLLAYLKANFSDLLDGDQIDISKHLGKSQKTAEILIAPTISVTNFEGIQYLVASPYWEGAKVSLYSAGEESGASAPRLKLGKFITQIIMQDIASEGFDLSNATNLHGVLIQNNSAITSIDLSHSAMWGQRDKETEGEEDGSSLVMLGCSALKEIKLPEKDELKVFDLYIEHLDALETFDMSKVKMIVNFSLSELNENFNLVYPELTIFYGKRGTTFACSKSIFDRESTKAFLKENYTDRTPGLKQLKFSDYLYYNEETGYDWETSLNM